jgi:hypothetical protein
MPHLFQPPRFHHHTNTVYTQKNGAVSIVNTIDTAPFFRVYPVFHEDYRS